MTEAERIVAGLSEAQRRMVRLWGTVAHRAHWPVALLIGKGLLSYRRRWWLIGAHGVFLTRLGEQVRAILLKGTE